MRVKRIRRNVNGGESWVLRLIGGARRLSFHLDLPIFVDGSVIVVTAGIAAVPEQLREDARILGASRGVVARTVTLPYVMRTMRPALVTQAVTVFKDSSVVVVLGVSDLTTNARIALGGDVTNAPFWVATYLMVGLLYWCVAFALSRAARHDRSPWQRSVRSAHA